MKENQLLLTGLLCLLPMISIADTVNTSAYFELGDAQQYESGTKSSVKGQSYTKKANMITSGEPPAYINRESWEYGDWALIGTPINCLEWTPAPSTVKDGQKFTQQKECDQTRERIVRIYNHWTNGDKTLKTHFTEQQADGVFVDRDAIGTKPYITRQTTSYTNWTNSGSPYSCSSWNPSTTTVEKGKKFTQSRSCKQKQNRDANTYDIWSDGRKTLKSTKPETKAITTNQSKSATGTKEVVTFKWKHVGYQCFHESNVPVGPSVSEGSKCTEKGKIIYPRKTGSVCGVPNVFQALKYQCS
ncbi:hypothetical protein OTK49_02570 [Vibrio coralliirubri]|uniref:hypothetical protein n=1 Tax=Vibrio coralliirubri TaxID=1516159 RepID=UPI002283C5AE|nr:hypothetical protein [Vibrio coralliirubri]MCY9861401.1 hypothetical protein [Vibrio coralliirubri]